MSVRLNFPLIDDLKKVIRALLKEKYRTISPKIRVIKKPLSNFFFAMTFSARQKVVSIMAMVIKVFENILG